MNTTTEDHARCDEFVGAMLAASKVKPCCAKGCHACCSESVYASEAEVNHILEALTDQQKTELADRVLDWFDRVRGILPKPMPHFAEYRGLGAPCPLLKNGLCSVYDRRPMGCRVWFAHGNPKDCEMPARANQAFAQFPDALFLHMGVPARVNDEIVQDHLGVLLAEKLLGLKVVSGSRKVAVKFMVARMFKNMGEKL